MLITQTPLRISFLGGASIGCGDALLLGIRIERRPMVGTETEVTKAAPRYKIVTGNPAHFIGIC